MVPGGEGVWRFKSEVSRIPRCSATQKPAKGMFLRLKLWPGIDWTGTFSIPPRPSSCFCPCPPPAPQSPQEQAASRVAFLLPRQPQSKQHFASPIRIEKPARVKMSPWKDVALDVWAHIYGFVQCLGAICWAGVLLMVECFDLLFPKRKSFRGETILITGTMSSAVSMPWPGGREGCQAYVLSFQGRQSLGLTPPSFSPSSSPNTHRRRKWDWAPHGLEGT